MSAIRAKGLLGGHRLLSLTRMPTIDTALVESLIRQQFPDFAEQPVTAIDGGWDHRSFRLGRDLGVRLPSAAIYAPQVVREHRWLPFLAAQLDIPLPKPIALGGPALEFPWHWAIRSWVAGTRAADQPLTESVPFASDVGDFLRALQHVEPRAEIAPGVDNFFRGGLLGHYADEVATAIARVGDPVRQRACQNIFAAALAVYASPSPCWLHGDLLPGNLLVEAGRLVGVIDFGLMAVGDPACDLMIAWSYFKGSARAAFFDAAGADRAIIARGRGWALWKAVIIIAGVTPRPPAEIAWAQAMLDAVLAD